jgi:hypothetical protein
MLSNKKVAIFLAIVLVVTVSGSLLVLSQIKGNDDVTDNNLAGNSSEVKISEFNWTSGWAAGPVGLMMGRSFNITITNFGIENFDGLILTLKMSNANGSELQTKTNFYGSGVIGEDAEFGPFDGKLFAKETRTLRGAVTTDFGTLTSAWAIGPVTTLAQISLNCTVLDEFETIDG